MNQTETLTVDKLLELLSTMVVVRATINAGNIRYATEQDMPRAFRVDQLPTAEQPPQTDIFIVGPLTDPVKKPTGVGLIVCENAFALRDAANVLYLEYSMKKSVIQEKVLSSLKSMEWDQSAPSYARWIFRPYFTHKTPHTFYPEGRAHIIDLDPHDPRLMVHYAYILGRLREYILKTKNWNWQTMHQRLEGFVRAGIAKLKP